MLLTKANGKLPKLSILKQLDIAIRSGFILMGILTIGIKILICQLLPKWHPLEDLPIPILVPIKFRRPFTDLKPL